MIEWVDTFPEINVEPAEYSRLLGYPREHVMTGRARELAQWARMWYGKNGRPWIYARQCDQLNMTNGSIVIDGVSFASPRLQKTLADASAESVFLVAVSAGPQTEAEAQRLWLEEKPDEYFFLEIFGSAVVEYLTTMAGARLCSWAERNGMAVLPHYSPGYPEWDIGQQPQLMELLQRGGEGDRGERGQKLPQRIEVLSSGMLRPKKSLLAVFGLTTHTERVRRLTDLVPCENCSFANCQYRRVPYAAGPGGGGGVAEAEMLAPVGAKSPVEDEPAAKPLVQDASYAVNARALQRWGDERLTLTNRADGTVDAVFRYEGTTCSNMGRALMFDYTVKLGPRSQGYPLREMLCAPAAGDEGHKYMCRYMSNAEHLMVAIDHEKPLLGKPLNDILTWERPKSGAGCYCEPSSRQHKWALALETIHYALAQQEKASGLPVTVTGEKT